MKIGQLTIVNGDKWTRAVEGNIGKGGQLEGGVGVSASDSEKRAAYDKLGGLVRKDNRNIKTGSFYDFKKREPRKKAEIVFVMRDLEGTEVEIPEGKEVPIEVRAAEKAKEEAKEKRGVGRPKKVDIEEDEVEDGVEDEGEEKDE